MVKQEMLVLLKFIISLYVALVVLAVDAANFLFVIGCTHI